MKILALTNTEFIHPIKGSRIVIAVELDTGEHILAEHFSDMPEGEFHEVPVTIIRAQTAIGKT